MEKLQIEQFNQVTEDMIIAFPELKEKLDNELARWESDFPGLYNVMGAVFNPYLKKVLLSRKPDHKKLVELFSFIEKIVTNKNKYTSEFGVTGICESIIFEGNIAYKKASIYAEEKTKHHLDGLYDFFIVNPPRTSI